MKATIYTGGLGINNKVPPQDLLFDLETGVGGLQSGRNVFVNKAGKLTTRRPNRQLTSLPCHSTWMINKDSFYMVEDRDNDSAIVRVYLNDDGTVEQQGIWGGLHKGKKFSYAQLGTKVLYCNGAQKGQLDASTREDWPVSIWPRRSSRYKKRAVPAGSHIDILSGRVLIAVENELFITEAKLPGIYDRVAGRRRYEGRIIMVAAVQTGAYVSTEDAVYFASGLIPKDWSMRKVLEYPAKEYGINQRMENPSDFGIQTTEMAVVFATERGPVVGLHSGEPINLIDNNLFLPSGCGIHAGSIMVVDDSMIIQSGV